MTLFGQARTRAFRLGAQSVSFYLRSWPEASLLPLSAASIGCAIQRQQKSFFPIGCHKALDGHKNNLLLSIRYEKKSAFPAVSFRCPWE
jgi:hypothetical protein